MPEKRQAAGAESALTDSCISLQAECLIVLSIQQVPDTYNIVDNSSGYVEWNDGWYVVPPNTEVSIKNTAGTAASVIGTNDVRLVLCDGSKHTLRP